MLRPVPCSAFSEPSYFSTRAIAYEKSGRWFTAEEPFLGAKERTDVGSSAFRHPRSELIAPLPQEVEPAFNNRKLHMRLPWQRRGSGWLQDRMPHQWTDQQEPMRGCRGWADTVHTKGASHG